MSFNPALATLALGGLSKIASAEKRAFVPLGPDAQMAQQPAQPGQPGAAPQPQAGAAPQAQPPQPQQPPADPASGGQMAAPQQDPNAGSAGGGAVPQPSSGTPGMDPAQTGQNDQMRAIMREEINAAQEKPKKLSTNERMVQLEGLVLRMMEHQGLIKPDQNLQQNQAPTGEGQIAGGMPQVQPMAGGGDPNQDAAESTAVSQEQPGAPGAGGSSLFKAAMDKSAAAALDTYTDELVNSHGYTWAAKEAQPKELMGFQINEKDLGLNGKPAQEKSAFSAKPANGLSRAAAQLRGTRS